MDLLTALVNVQLASHLLTIVEIMVFVLMVAALKWIALMIYIASKERNAVTLNAKVE